MIYLFVYVAEAFITLDWKFQYEYINVFFNMLLINIRLCFPCKLLVYRGSRFKVTHTCLLGFQWRVHPRGGDVNGPLEQLYSWSHKLISTIGFFGILWQNHMLCPAQMYSFIHTYKHTYIPPIHVMETLLSRALWHAILGELRGCLYVRIGEHYNY